MAIPGPGTPGSASTAPTINNAKPATSRIPSTSLDLGFVDGWVDIIMQALCRGRRTQFQTSMLGRIAIASMASEICACVSMTG